MKTLILVRHAKSSWADPGTSDRDRPLNERGKRDAPQMARRLRAFGLQPDLLVSSPARRARKTAELFARELDYDPDRILFIAELYLAHRDSYYPVLAGLPASASTVAVFAHNPGITDFANALTPEVQLDNMPTASMFAVQIQADRWQQIPEAPKRFLFFDFPKNSPDH